MKFETLVRNGLRGVVLAALLTAGLPCVQAQNKDAAKDTATTQKKDKDHDPNTDNDKNKGKHKGETKGKHKGQTEGKHKAKGHSH